MRVFMNSTRFLMLSVSSSTGVSGTSSYWSNGFSSISSSSGTNSPHSPSSFI